MAMFKSSEEREVERREREAERARAEAAAAERRKEAEEQEAQRRWAASPAGQAHAAKQAGHRFFEVQLRVGSNEGSSTFGMAQHNVSIQSSALALADIEKAGWRLEHASYFHMITGETSSAKMLGTGEATAVTGQIIGAYLFRATDPE